jgi:hypothetical protein
MSISFASSTFRQENRLFPFLLVQAEVRFESGHSV